MKYRYNELIFNAFNFYVDKSFIMGVQVVWGSTWYSPQFFYAKSVAPKHLNLDIYRLLG